MVTKRKWTNLHTLDWTTGKIMMYDGKKYTTLTKENLLDAIAKMSPGTNLVGEYAHFGVPRVGLSMAQPFTKEEMNAIYAKCKECKVVFELFPHFSTARAYNYSKIKKMESAKDPDLVAECIWNLLVAYPEISLMKTPVAFKPSPKRLEGYDIIGAKNTGLGTMLNLVRGAGKAGYMQEEDANWQFLQKHLEDIAGELVDGKIINGELSEATLSAFNLGVDNRYKNSKKRGKINFNQIKHAQIYTILAILQDHDGTNKIRKSTGELPGWKFIKRYVIRMTPFHLKGGLPRSTLYWHGLRNWVGNQAGTKGLYRAGYCPKDGKKWVKQMTPAQEQDYLKYRRLYCKAVKELYCAFKRRLES